MNRFGLIRSLLSAVVFAAVLLPAVSPTGAQTLTSQNTTSLFIKGTVRDVAGAPIPDSIVTLEEETRSESVEAKIGKDGTFSFGALKAGTYVVRVNRIGFRGAFTEPMELSPGQTKRIEFVLKAINPDSDTLPPEMQPSSGAPTSQTMEFSDKPNFTVAGVTAWNNLGLHASETNARTSDALAKEMAALKGDDAPAKATIATAHRPSHGEATAGRDAASRRAAGDRYEKTGDALAAELEYEAAVRLDPSEANYFAWGTELLLHRAIAPAVEVFGKGAAAHPESLRMRIGLGAALYARGSTQEAARRACEASNLQPADSVPYLFLGKMQRSAIDSLPCAEEKLARFVREQPENALANYYYAVALWKRARGAKNSADLRKQEALLQKATRIDPKLAEAYLQLGILYAAQNGTDRAIGAYKQAIAANADLGEAHYRLGLAYKRLGDATKAEQELALYKQAQDAESAAAERQHRELQQFVVILKEKDKKE